MAAPLCKIAGWSGLLLKYIDSISSVEGLLSSSKDVDRLAVKFCWYNLIINP